MPRSRVRLFVFAMLAVLGAAAIAFVGCIPGYTFGEAPSGDGGGSDGSASDGSLDSTSDSPSGDSSNGADAPVDSGGDSTPIIPFDGGIVSVAVADAGSKINSTGYGYQLHVIYAENDKRYWLFYVDDTGGQIKTLHSTDFVTWVGGAAIALTGTYGIADGNNFSLAYANIGGKDVVHIVIDASGSGYMTFHVRAQITGGALSSGPPIALATSTNGGPCTYDGPATTITPQGLVYDVTGWNDHEGDGTNCDTDVYVAARADLGTTSWDAGTFEYDGYYVSQPGLAFAHDLLDMPEAGAVLLLYPDWDNSGTESSDSVFESIGWGLSTGFYGGVPGDEDAGVYEPELSELFGNAGQEASYNDWTACRLSDTDIHLVRHVLNVAGTSNSLFEEDVYNGSTWQPTSTPPPASTSLSDTGVVLVSGTDPTKGMLLVTIGNDYALNVAKWTAAGGWTSVGKLAGNGNGRQSLAGSGCGSTRPTVMWTETIGPANLIESADLEGFLQ
jgi:hypothetical protein